MSEQGRSRRPRGRITAAVAGIVGAGVLGAGIWLGVTAATDTADTTGAANVAARGTLRESTPPTSPLASADATARPKSPTTRPSTPSQRLCPTTRPVPPTADATRRPVPSSTADPTRRPVPPSTAAPTRRPARPAAASDADPTVRPGNPTCPPEQQR
ncbi:hypothetical protein Acsp04_33540 [Actinomadura sp. NBRC 104425]|uniref:hypothetical protein n=1 Tax=Actinomadura sp. NBRC 104425 TaxID=3032204 RepID=UPI0024A25350|nr:hypothetical protein [Actinomadura sp. NBRC 104425]GLZ13119.1 hypothetical protein Acsp04_33540 [Actinomadura sp. NBRC 104425]